MRKFLLFLGLIILTGCLNPAKKLQTNVFGDLWQQYVVEKDEEIIKNRSTVIESLQNYEKFAELNAELDSLREFLILGETETEESPIPLEKVGDSLRIKDLKKVFCEEIEEEIKCFAKGETEKMEVFCFDENDEAISDSREKKYCEFRGKTEFKEGLMKIADQNNEDLINEFRESIKIFRKGSLSKKSLEKEFKKLKKNIQRVCNKQSSKIPCGF